jgi:hypothetical protein
MAIELNVSESPRRSVKRLSSDEEIFVRNPRSADPKPTEMISMPSA